jgi:hypothetical protein
LLEWLQIRVFCRLRPAASSSATCNADGVSLALTADDGKRHSFAFDKVGSLYAFAVVCIRQPCCAPNEGVQVDCSIRIKSLQCMHQVCLQQQACCLFGWLPAEHRACMQVFGPATQQASVFAEVSELVQSALDGYQVLDAFETQ